MKNIKNILAAAAIATATIFTPSAEAGVVCGQNSFVIEHSRNDSYVMFYNGGRVRFAFDDGTQAQGRWWWQGDDVVTDLNGYITVWDDVRTQRCTDHY